MTRSRLPGMAFDVGTFVVFASGADVRIVEINLTVRHHVRRRAAGQKNYDRVNIVDIT